MEKIILVGFGGHGKSVADCIERAGKYQIVGYTDVRKADTEYPYLGTDDVLSDIYAQGVLNAAICIGYMGKGTIRQEIYSKLKRMGYKFPVIVDTSAIVSASAIISDGVFIGKGAIVNAEAKIGKMAIINTRALIEHECVVGDFSHVAVGAVLCGQVKIGKAAFIGANATVIQCRNVGVGAIVPAGEVIR